MKNGTTVNNNTEQLYQIIILIYYFKDELRIFVLNCNKNWNKKN